MNDELVLILQPYEIPIVDELFERLSEEYPDEAEVAKLRYFAGFNHREIAEALGVSTTTAYNHWALAKSWLCREFRKNE